MTTSQATNIAQSAMTRQAVELQAQGDHTAAQQYLDAIDVLGKSRVVVVDADELAAARRDPEVRETLASARRSYAKSVRL